MINIDHYFPFQNNDRIVIGCSTGPDSMALLDMLLKVRDQYHLAIVVAHVNHNIRKESYVEAELQRAQTTVNSVESLRNFGYYLQFVADTIDETEEELASQNI